MTGWLKFARTALLIATVCVAGLTYGSGCHKGDEGEDRGDSAKKLNKDRVRPIQDKPVDGGAQLIVPERVAHA
jgi:hypothetical protein